ncbi:hypothetical protein BaRGS_00028740, partial [Batillaria attramentaria]
MEDGRLTSGLRPFHHLSGRAIAGFLKGARDERGGIMAAAVLRIRQTYIVNEPVSGADPWSTVIFKP